MSPESGKRYKDLELKCLSIILEELEVIYTGGLMVIDAIDIFTREKVGWRLVLYLNNKDKPMGIDYIGDDVNEFLKLIRMQIHEDSISSHVMYCSSSLVETHVEPINNQPCLQEMK